MSEFQSSLQLPVIDISQPLTPSSLSTLSQSCQDSGFFLVTNHGIPEDLFHKLSLVSKQLFTLPSDTKQKIGLSSTLNTYTPPHFKACPFFEAFSVTRPDFFASAKNSADALFDQPNSEFCEIMQEYGSKMTELAKRVTKIVLMTLGEGIAKKYHESEFSNCRGYLRMVNYLPPETVEAKEVEGLAKHTDVGCITFVYQGEIGGLQVKTKEGKWLDIEPCKGTLVVNIGDILHAWSNGKLRSSEHRVVLKQPVNRLSLTFFWFFENEKVILAPDEVVEEGKPRMFKPFECMEYIIFRKINEKSKHEKVGFTVKDFAGIKCDG